MDYEIESAIRPRIYSVDIPRFDGLYTQGLAH